MRTGNKNIAASKAKTPFTAMPTMRNGSMSSQTIGYNTKASKAIGQHKMKRMHQRKKAAMAILQEAPVNYILRTRLRKSFQHVVVEKEQRDSSLRRLRTE
jgi:hypothetical protein